MCTSTDQGRSGEDGSPWRPLRSRPGDGGMSGPTTVVVEVTDTLAAGFTTGIQRVVREVIAGLDGPLGDDVDVVPVVTPESGASFRTLSVEERDRLRHHPAGGRAGRRADDFGPLAPLARRILDRPSTIRARQLLARLLGRRRQLHPLHPELRYDPPPGSVFLDLEGSWFDPTPRGELLPRLRDNDVQPVVFVHDVMPVVHPEWFAPHHIRAYRAWLDAHLRHSRLALVNSERTGTDLRAVAREQGRDMPISVVPLGADHSVRRPRPVELPPSIGRFLVVVGTLEPRKNQRVVLDVFDRLHREHPDLGLVLVGKEGWMVDDLVNRIRRHPEHGHRLLWLGGIDDDQLAWLYEHALLAIAPSLYEGFGVPVLEALGRGCATLASTGGAQPEATGGAAELFDPDDVAALTDLVRLHLTDDDHHQYWVRKAREHRAPTWADTARAVSDAVREVAAAQRRDR